MYQYRVNRLLRITNSDTLTAELDLGFNIKTEVAFRIARVAEPEVDLESEVDLAVELRQNIRGWFKTAPKPWTVQMYKEDGIFSGDVMDKNGRLLSNDLTGGTTNDEHQVVNYEVPPATLDPGAVS